MAIITVNNVELFYEEYGDGEETIVFSHGFLFSHKMFEKQINALSDKYRIIAFDHRGQGKSEITNNGYDIDSITEDAYQLISELTDPPVYFVGLSMGGFVGMRLAVRHPELLKSLVLINTSAQAASVMKLFRFRLLRIVGRIFGLGVVVGHIMEALFGSTFMNNESREDEINKWKEFLKNRDKIGVYRAFDAAVFRPSFEDELSKIDLPVLIIGGDEDQGLSSEESEELHDKIDGSELVILENVGHSSVIEAPERVTQEITDFLTNR